MQLARGRDHLAIPGPSVIPDRVLRAMHRSAPNIYAGELVDITESIVTDLKKMANGCPETEVAIYHGNGHAAWEACLSNLFSSGDRILVVVTGRFGSAWAEMASSLGITVDVIDVGIDRPVTAERVSLALENDTKHEIKAVLSVQTDTATSSRNDIQAMGQAIAAARHPALLIIDAIASFGCEPMNMAGWGVDMLLTASQKGLMTPPGIALVFIGPDCWSLHAMAKLRTPYWDIEPRVKPTMFPERFCGTPPTHHLYGLREALTMIMEEGLDNVLNRHRVLASTVWRAVDEWGAVGSLRFQIKNESHRSFAVTTIQTDKGDAPRIRQWCESNLGVVLGVGLGGRAAEPPVDTLFRIGHMGHLNPSMLFGTLACVDTALKSLDIPHGNGALQGATSHISDWLKLGYTPN